jgi:hypothetical protein
MAMITKLKMKKSAAQPRNPTMNNIQRFPPDLECVTSGLKIISAALPKTNDQSTHPGTASEISRDPINNGTKTSTGTNVDNIVLGNAVFIKGQSLITAQPSAVLHARLACIFRFTISTLRPSKKFIKKKLDTNFTN